MNFKSSLAKLAVISTFCGTLIAGLYLNAVSIAVRSDRFDFVGIPHRHESWNYGWPLSWGTESMRGDTRPGQIRFNPFRVLYCDHSWILLFINLSVIAVLATSASVLISTLTTFWTNPAKFLMLSMMVLVLTFTVGFLLPYWGWTYTLLRLPLCFGIASIVCIPATFFISNGRVGTSK